MENVLTSIKAHLYDRIVSPLSGALITSWCLWNYKVIMVFLSSESMAFKLNFVDSFYREYFFTNFFDLGENISNAVVNGFLGPIITSATYIFIYPVFAIPVYRFSLFVQKKYESARNKHQREKLLTYEQSIELHRKIAELELHQESAHKEYLNRINALNELVSEKEALLAVSDKKNKELELERDILRDSTESFTEKSDSDLSGSLNFDGETLVSDGDKAKDILLQSEAAELENYIIDTLFQKKVGDQFFFSDLIPSETWSHYSNERRYALEQSFKKGVANQRYKNVKVAEKQMVGVITKYEILDFPDYADADLVLIYILEKMAANKQKTVQLNELRAWRDWNYYLLKNGMEYLLNKGFAESVNHNGRASACRITKAGELFLAGSR